MGAQMDMSKNGCCVCPKCGKDSLCEDSSCGSYSYYFCWDCGTVFDTEKKEAKLYKCKWGRWSETYGGNLYKCRFPGRKPTMCEAMEFDLDRNTFFFVNRKGCPLTNPELKDNRERMDYDYDELVQYVQDGIITKLEFILLQGETGNEYREWCIRHELPFSDQTADAFLLLMDEIVMDGQIIGKDFEVNEEGISYE